MRQFKSPKVGADRLADGAVATAKLEDLAVAAAKIADQAVTAGKIDDQAVTAGKIDDQAVTAGKIDDQAVTAAKIAAQAVTTGNIDDQAVTPGKASFLSQLGATGRLYFGHFDGEGNNVNMPSGWSVSKPGTGEYNLSHNLGTTNYVAVASPYNSTWAFPVLIDSSYTSTGFTVTVYGGVFDNLPDRVDSGVLFMVAVFD